MNDRVGERCICTRNSLGNELYVDERPVTSMNDEALNGIHNILVGMRA